MLVNVCVSVVERRVVTMWQCKQVMMSVIQLLLPHRGLDPLHGSYEGG